MRTRHSTGGIRKQRGKWIGHWYSDGKRKSQIVGSMKDMTKGKAREEVAKIVAAERATLEPNRHSSFGEFVKEVYLPFYRRKWKLSTRGSNENRVQIHLVERFRDRDMTGFTRDELQDLLDLKASQFSFSTGDHLRWDLKQIFDMAVSEGHVERNPALLLFTPRTAIRAERRVMNIEQVQICFSVLAQRERLIAKLAIIGGIRPGEIFALTWGRLSVKDADIRQRVYRGVVDTPKTNLSVRRAALSEGLVVEIEAWRAVSINTDDKAWAFPSERMTPLAMENVWRRNIGPKLDAVGLKWVNFQVMRRTHSSLMGDIGVERKLVADQCGHSVDVSENVYRQTSVAVRREAVNRLEQALA
jgi:integrase